MKKGEIDAAVRGTLDSKEAMSAVKRSFGLDHVLRVALMQPRGGSIFFLAPVGVDEGWTVEQKVEIMQLGSKMIRRMGIVPAIGVMSGGRISDKGRSPMVDRSIDDAEEVARIGRAQGLDVVHCEIIDRRGGQEQELPHRAGRHLRQSDLQDHAPGGRRQVDGGAYRQPGQGVRRHLPGEGVLRGLHRAGIGIAWRPVGQAQDILAVIPVGARRTRKG